MSVYLSERLAGLQAYVPGEQTADKNLIKLNTNENPYFPSRYAVGSITPEKLSGLRLYQDPANTELCAAIAAYYGVDKENVLPANGSDEALAFCFAAFGGSGAVFPDVTYGFYKVFAKLFGVNYREIPLKEDFSVDSTKYVGCGGTVFLANPNAQTGIYMPLNEIERIVSSNSANIVVIDEAYVDFGGESAVKLCGKYNNLIVVQTFSKSRSLAGARVGFAIACRDLISDLKRVKYSFNPYSVNGLSASLAAAAISDVGYFRECTAKIIRTRERLAAEARKLGFSVLPSSANFLLVKNPKATGETMYSELRKRGIIVRHFPEERIKNFVRITVGTDGQTDTLIRALKQIEAEL